MTFTSLKIENFRGIQSFTCDRLARVTLIVGRNNCGKTSLLEALDLLANRRTTQIGPLLNARHQLDTQRVADLDVLFNNPTKPLTIQASDVSGMTRAVTITRMTEEQSTFVTPKANAVITPEPRYRLEQTFHDCPPNAPETSGLLDFTEEPGPDEWLLRFHTAPTATQTLTDPAFAFVSAQHFDISTPFLTEVILQRSEHMLVNALKGLDSRIQTLQLVDDKVMVGLEGVPRLLPVQIMGDGVRRLTAILSALWVCRGGCVCIDEIDNGLHNSVQPLVWETLIRYAQEWDVQIIATSHHLDLLQAIDKVYKDNPDAIPPQDFAYIVLSREGNAIRPYAFDLTDLTSAIELGLEVR